METEVGCLRRFVSAVMLALVICLLGGCAMPTVDELYCLPKRSNADNNLQQVIDLAMDGLQYSAPISGANQQTVQSADLDGDGTNEYLLFAKDSGEKTLKILIFSKLASGYVLMDTIEGYGFAFEFVEYANMDDRPGLEIIVGRQVSDQLARSVSVYRFTGGFARQLMTASYTRILTTDFDDNGLEDIFLISPGQTEDAPATAVLYTFRSGEISRSTEAVLSASADALRRVDLTRLDSGTTAVIVSAALDEQTLVTDVFTALDHRIEPIVSGLRTPTLDNYYLYPEDIDGDGVLELPALRQLDVPQDAREQYLVFWQSADETGALTDKLCMYLDPDDGWYLRLDPQRVDGLTLIQTEDCYCFGRFDGQSKDWNELFTVWVMTGPEREEQAAEYDRYPLYYGETELYAVSFAQSGEDWDIEELIDGFRLLRMDWSTEENRGEENEKSTDS